MSGGEQTNTFYMRGRVWIEKGNERRLDHERARNKRERQVRYLNYEWARNKRERRDRRFDHERMRKSLEHERVRKERERRESVGEICCMP